jgi:type IV pilus assembly protein PilM
VSKASDFFGQFLSDNRSLLGLDLGSRMIKGVELTREGGKVKVSACFAREAPDPATRKEVLQDLLAGAGLRTRRVATAVSGRTVTVRYIALPVATDDELKSALPLEADKYIPYDVEEVYLDGQRLPLEQEQEEGKEGKKAGAKESKVLMVAAKKGLVHDQVALIESVKLLPVLVDVDAFALGNAFIFSHGDRYNPAEVMALIDIGAAKTNVSILRGGVALFTREFYRAGDDLTDAVAKRLGGEKEAAEEIKRKPDVRLQEVLEATRNVVEDIGNEIRLSFDYFESQFEAMEVSQAYLSGGGALFANLREDLETLVQRPVAFWKATEGVELAEGVDPLPMDAFPQQMAIALGLAARLGTGV